MNPTGLLATLPETLPTLPDEQGCCGELTLHGLAPSPGIAGGPPWVALRYDCECGGEVYVEVTLNDGGELCVDEDFAAAVHEATASNSMRDRFMFLAGVE